MITRRITHAGLEPQHRLRRAPLVRGLQVVLHQERGIGAQAQLHRAAELLRLEAIGFQGARLQGFFGGKVLRVLDLFGIGFMGKPETLLISAEKLKSKDPLLNSTQAKSGGLEPNRW